MIRVDYYGSLIIITFGITLHLTEQRSFFDGASKEFMNNSVSNNSKGLDTFEFVYQYSNR